MMMAQLAVNTGMTMEEVGELTWDDVHDIYSYWEVHPPQSLLMEGFVGYKAPEVKPTTANSLKEIAAKFGG